NFIAMIIYGLGFAFIFPSMNKVIADASSKVDRGKAYGVFYAFFSLGAVVGSAASGLFAEILVLPFLVCVLIMILSVAAFIFMHFSRLAQWLVPQLPACLLKFSGYLF